MFFNSQLADLCRQICAQSGRGDVPVLKLPHGLWMILRIHHQRPSISAVKQTTHSNLTSQGCVGHVAFVEKWTDDKDRELELTKHDFCCCVFPSHYAKILHKSKMTNSENLQWCTKYISFKYLKIHFLQIITQTITLNTNNWASIIHHCWRP